MRATITLLVGALGIAGRAGAQEALFLVPERASVGVGSPVRLSAGAGTAEAAPTERWPTERIAHFFARTAWTQENRETLPAAEGIETVAAWPADRPGVLLLGMELEPTEEMVPAADFAAFVERALGEGGRAALGELPREGEVRLLRAESAKALVSVRGAGAEPASIATSKAGQRVEIRPLMDPTALMPGSDLAVRVYAAIAGGGVVIATNSTTGETVRAATDDSAIANVPIASAGRWRLEFHAVARREGPAAGALFDVHTATLTFDVREEAGR